MMKTRSIRLMVCFLVVGVFVVGYAGPVHAKKKDSNNEATIKRIEEEIKAYEVTLAAAEERMVAANEEGARVEPLLKPAKEEVRLFKVEVAAQQRKRAAASREMQEKLRADPELKEARLAMEQAEGKRDELAGELMLDIELEADYQQLAAKRDGSAKRLEEAKQQGAEEADVPGAAAALLADQAALTTYVQDRLMSVPAYEAVEEEVGAAQLHRRATEREVTARYLEESGLESIDALYAEKRDAYQASRKASRELERKFKALRSTYKDAEGQAAWASRRIALHKDRIATLKKRKKKK